MSILIWTISGLIASLVTSRVVNKPGRNRPVDLVLGVTGAVIGGWIFAAMGLAEGARLTIDSLLVAVICAIAALVTYHFLFRVAARDAHFD